MNITSLINRLKRQLGFTTEAPSIEGFVRFVNKRHPNTPVTHSQGWDECALGDYMKRLGHYDPIEWRLTVPRMLFEQEQNLFVSPDMVDPGDWDTYGFSTLMGWLNAPVFMSSAECDTYGGIQRWIKSMPHLQHIA